MKDLPWATWPWNRCPAHTGYMDELPDWGRCDLKKRHKGNHVLERGMYYCEWEVDLKFASIEYTY